MLGSGHPIYCVFAIFAFSDEKKVNQKWCKYPKKKVFFLKKGVKWSKVEM